MPFTLKILENHLNFFSIIISLFFVTDRQIVDQNHSLNPIENVRVVINIFMITEKQTYIKQTHPKSVFSSSVY